MTGKVNLDRWTAHLAAARREGKNLTQYARSRGLSRHTLYAARQMLRRVDGKPTGVESRQRAGRTASELVPSVFAAVRLSAPCAALIGSVPRLRAQLPNEVMLELLWGGAEAGLLAAAIQALSGR